MWYYNENPQVTLLKEKFEKLKAENEELKNEIAHLILDVRCLDDELNEIKEKRKKEDEDTRIRAEHFVKVFNSAPWYKKMFYKFKI